MRQGLHAKDDSNATRAEMFAAIAGQDVRFDSTFLAKVNAYVHAKAAGPVRLYHMAFYLHFKEIIRQVSDAEDEVFVIAGHLQTNAKRNAILDAVSDVCKQSSTDRTVTPCVWDAQSSWGIHVADYALWSNQRSLLGTTPKWHPTCVEPRLRSCVMPWGRDG